MKAPKLRHKGLIIVTMPVVLSLVYTGALIFLLKEAENQLKQETFAARLVGLSSRLRNLYYEGVYDGYLYHITRSERMHERAKKCALDIPRAESRLKELLSHTDREKKLFEEAAIIGAEIQKILEEVHKGAPSDLAGTVDKVIFRRSVFHRLYNLNEKYTDIIEYAKTIEKKAPQGSEQSRTTVLMFAVLGILANVMLAVFLSIYFTRNITRRLDTISDNAVRLAREAPLNEPLEGEDEIANLDYDFHRMARLLEEADRQKKSLVDNAVNVLASLDESLKFIEVSPASMKIWGYEPGELIGTRAVNLFSDKEEASGTLQSLVLSKGEQTFDSMMNHRDGKRIYVRWDVYWSDNESALFCVASDVTKEIQLMRFKQQLVDTVAHDLRSPITSIQNTLSLISMGVYGDINEEIKDKIVRTEQQSDRLIRLINDLLDFERLESGRMEMNLKDTDVSLIIEESLEAVSGAIAASEIEIKKLDCSGKVVVDLDRILQVMINILSNAIKFSPKGSTIEVNYSQDGARGKFSIKDRGPGVPDDFKDKIFERFEMIGDERQQGKMGSGLGLSICKHIIELHRGTIGVTDNSGRGSTFFFTVPLAKGQ